MNAQHTANVAQQLFESNEWRAQQNALFHSAGVARNLTVSEMWQRAVYAAHPDHEHGCSTHYHALAVCDCGAAGSVA